MIQDIKVPEISENVVSGTVVGIMVKVGDTVAIDDPILELETDKAVVEIPTPYQGQIAEILVEEGDEVKIGQTIARVETAPAETPTADAEDTTAETAPAPTPEKSQPEPAPTPSPSAKTPEPSPAPADPPSAPVEPPSGIAQDSTPAATNREPAAASPSVRRLARELGVDIHSVRAGKPGGRITEADVKAHVKHSQISAPGVSHPSSQTPAAGTPQMPDFSRWGEIEVVDLPTVRRITAASVATSWNTVPHVTQFDQADITSLQDFLRHQRQKAAQGGVKLTITAVLTKVCAAALRKFTRFNASIDPRNNTLILKHYVHIGLMVDTPRGLLVPVIRNADNKSINDLALEISDLAERARGKTIKPDELEGGTFSISNLGGIGGTGFTPIVLWPQAAILGVSRSLIAPKYVDGEFRPHTLLPLSLSYDHRIIDGAEAARFLRWVCETLEYPLTMHLES
jgi:pyruvate dehydrogenase E2 component (dihydrolipoamide acetyltransferase)